MGSRVWRRLLAIAASLLALSAFFWAIPPLRARIKALGVLAEATGVPFPRPWARSVQVRTMEVAPDVVGDMYIPGDEAPVLLFVPGAALKGREDPRVVRAARALAEAGRRVFVPELTLYSRTFEPRDIDRIAAAIDALSSDGPVGVVAFSYGGSLALIAGTDPRVAGDISYIATFGAYFDLANVIQGVTTGTTTLDGRRVPFDTVSQARRILVTAATRLLSASQSDELERAIDDEDPSGLRPATRAIYELLTNSDPARTEALVGALPKKLGSTLDDVSPSAHIDGLDVPVFIMQSKKDAATPWTEAVLLQRALSRTRLTMLEHFSHVDPPGIGGWLQDGPKAWWFASWIIEAQE